MAAGKAPLDRQVLTRARRALAALGCTPAESAALAVLVSGALAALALLWVMGRPGPPAGGGPAGGDPEPGGLIVQSEQVVIHVAGRVAAPGLYRLAGGARIADALAAAGGPLPDAALDALNLARPLSDGEQLLVPGPGAPAAAGGPRGQGSPAAQPGGPGAAAAAGGAWRPDGRLDLNVATAEDLEQLPGIGPVLAERIVQHREQHGGFAAVGDLREVSGIGEKTFQALAELVTV